MRVVWLEGSETAGIAETVGMAETVAGGEVGHVGPRGSCDHLGFLPHEMGTTGGSEKPCDV